MGTFWKDFYRTWVEFRGRNRPARSYSFPNNEIITSGIVLQISDASKASDASDESYGVYLNLHPTLYAVAIDPSGRIIRLKGGFNTLRQGRYIVHYVDRRNRVTTIPKTLETTLDGAQLDLEIFIIYQVIDPIKALEVQSPVDTLMLFIRSDLKEFIRSHTYDEIVGGKEGRMIGSNLIKSYIREQHSRRHQLSKLFYLADALIQEMHGDQKSVKTMDHFQTQTEKATPGTAINTKSYVSKSENRTKGPKVFISYARSDVDFASEIYEHLLANACAPWMDIYDLVPGQDWKLEIQKNITDSDFFIACLSNHSVSKIGYVQKELKEALFVFDQMPAGRIYLIPIKLDDCIVPDSLAGTHWLDWSSTKAKNLLLRAIETKEH